jgi:hypothetical protein
VRILSAKVIVCSPGRNFVTLKVETEDGVYGLGDATLNGRELAVASYLTEHVIPLLIGRDADRIEDIWHYLYKGAYWRRGPVTMTAIAAVARRLLGVHIVGEGATELIHIGQAVLNLEGTLDYFVENTFNYPTLAEAYKVAALDAWNRMPKSQPSRQVVGERLERARKAISAG